MPRTPICPISELPPGSRKIVDVAGKSIGVFNIHGRCYAIRNVCPHQLAPLCEGAICGTSTQGSPDDPASSEWSRDGEIIRCPWHGWEFDITTGQSIFNPHRMRVKSYEVKVEPPDDSPGVTASPEPLCSDPAIAGEDPSVETFDVKVEQGIVVLYT